MHITFLVHKGKEYTVRKYLASWGRELAGRVEVKHYPGLSSTGHTPWKRLSQALRAGRIGELREPGAPTGVPRIYVFTDLERLDPSETECALALWRRLEAHPDTVRILNHPTTCMRRFELLRRLHDRGLNRFGIYRAAEGPRPERWPVFVRDENEHAGEFSGLLHSPEDLERHLAALDEEALANRVVVEFCDTSDAAGIVRKYGAFKVGERVIARQIHFSRHWVVRVPDLEGAEAAREELEYVESNPHEEAVREIFSLARIDYGRVDYGLVDGKIQVWEINTNPMILIPRDREDPFRAEAHERFGRAFNEALEALGRPSPPQAPSGRGGS